MSKEEYPEAQYYIDKVDELYNEASTKIFELLHGSSDKSFVVFDEPIATHTPDGIAITLYGAGVVTMGDFRVSSSSLILRAEPIEENGYPWITYPAFHESAFPYIYEQVYTNKDNTMTKAEADKLISETLGIDKE